MSTDSYQLVDPPLEIRRRELWLQHAAGFILFEDIRNYAIAEIAPDISADARNAAEKAVDDCMYGLMMLVDGASGGLRNSQHAVALSLVARLTKADPAGDVTLQELDLREGDGVCLGFHGWKAGDFGEDAVATKRI